MKASSHAWALRALPPLVALAILACSLTGIAQTADDAVITILIHDGLVSVQAPADELTEGERAALQKAIAWKVSETPFQHQGTVRLRVRGKLLQELKTRLHGAEKQDPAQLARVLEELASGYVEERRTEYSGRRDEGDGELIMGQDFTISADQQRKHVIAIGSTGLVDGEVSDLVLIGANAKLGPNARVTGSALAIGSQLSVDPGAEVLGQELSLSLPSLSTLWGGASRSPTPSSLESLRSRIVLSVISLLVSLALGYVFMRAFPRVHARTAEYVFAHPAAAAGYGVLQMALIVPVAALLVLTIVGVLVVPLFLLTSTFTLWLGYVVGGIALGGWLTRERAHAGMTELLLGVSAMHLLAWLPIVGGLSAFCTAAVGLGALGRTAVVRLRQHRVRKEAKLAPTLEQQKMEPTIVANEGV